MAKTDVITSTGSWVCPAGVTSVDVECWGEGGHGGADSINNATVTGGGGGGAYSKKLAIAVTPAASYTVTIGTGGSSTDTWFSTTGTVLAKGGTNGVDNATTPGTGGQASGGVGDTKFSGGDGNSPGALHAGGGGSAAGDANNGATGSTNGTDSTGGAVGGGNGGGGISTGGGGGNGNTGTAPGGAGGGSYYQSGGTKQGLAARGEVRITYQVTTVTLDTVTLTDTTTILKFGVISVLETVTLSDVATAIRNIVRNLAKNAATAINTTKNSATVQNVTKNISTWINRDKF